MLHRGKIGTLLASHVGDDHRTTALRILLADDDAARAEALCELLSADPALTVLRASPADLLADAAAAVAPEVLLVDMARPDGDAVDDIAVNVPNSMVPFVDREDAAFTEATIGAGVSSYGLPRAPPPDVKPILRAAAATFSRYRTEHAEHRPWTGAGAARRVLDIVPGNPGGMAEKNESRKEGAP
jgi:AmiR/NasT family two-component response regulator